MVLEWLVQLPSIEMSCSLSAIFQWHSHIRTSLMDYVESLNIEAGHSRRTEMQAVHVLNASLFSVCVLLILGPPKQSTVSAFRSQLMPLNGNPMLSGFSMAVQSRPHTHCRCCQWIRTIGASSQIPCENMCLNNALYSKAILWLYLGVSINGGSQKWMVYNGKSN